MISSIYICERIAKLIMKSAKGRMITGQKIISESHIIDINYWHKKRSTKIYKYMKLDLLNEIG